MFTTKKFWTISIATITLILLLWIVYVLVQAWLSGSLSGDSEESLEPTNNFELVPFNPEVIPTEEELELVSSELMKLTLGKEQINRTDYSIPNTNIAFKQASMPTEALDLGLVIVAFERNPYAIKDTHPEVFRVLLGQEGSGIVKIAEGIEIDLNNLSQEYHVDNFYINRNDPTKVSYDLVIDGQTTSHEVDMLPYYQLYRQLVE